MKKGSDILIYEGGTAIAGTRDYTLTQAMETLENSSPYSANARTYEGTTIGWDLDVTRLLTAFKGAVLHPGHTYQMAFRVRDDVSDYMTGTALCLAADVTSTIGNLAKGTWRFVGIDELTSASQSDFNNDFNSDFLIS